MRSEQKYIHLAGWLERECSSERGFNGLSRSSWKAATALPRLSIPTRLQNCTVPGSPTLAALLMWTALQIGSVVTLKFESAFVVGA